jgi:hypothetical protein
MYQTRLRAGQLETTGFRGPEQVAPVVAAAAGLELTGEDLGQIEASG